MQLGAMDPAHTYAGPTDCLRQLVRAEGLRGVLRGLPGTIAREVPGNAIYFTSYEVTRGAGGHHAWWRWRLEHLGYNPLLLCHATSVRAQCVVKLHQLALNHPCRRCAG